MYSLTALPVKAWATTTVSNVSAALFKKISAEGDRGATGPTSTVSVEVDPVCAEVEQALRRRGQAILYGPPGTGKTHDGVVTSEARLKILSVNKNIVGYRTVHANLGAAFGESDDELRGVRLDDRA
jgi:hypothetical protein